MKNLWVVHDEPLAEWVADLSALRHEPSALLAWLQRVLALGEDREVYEVRAAPLAGYAREAEGPPPAFFARVFASSGVVDLFNFSSSGMRSVGGTRFSACARVSHFERGETVASVVDDLGALLRALRPDEVEEAPGLMKHSPPLAISGPKIDFRDPARSVWALRRDEARVRFQIFSDIWLPWVHGFLEERFDAYRRYDNRPLALRHTPRLNGFLAAVKAATLDAGGMWNLDEDSPGTSAGFMLTEDGIRLDAELPPGITEHPA